MRWTVRRRDDNDGVTARAETSTEAIALREVAADPRPEARSADALTPRVAGTPFPIDLPIWRFINYLDLVKR